MLRERSKLVFDPFTAASTNEDDEEITRCFVLYFSEKTRPAEPVESSPAPPPLLGQIISLCMPQQAPAAVLSLEMMMTVNRKKEGYNAQHRNSISVVISTIFWTVMKRWTLSLTLPLASRRCSLRRAPLPHTSRLRPFLRTILMRHFEHTAVTAAISTVPASLTLISAPPSRAVASSGAAPPAQLP